MLPLALLVPLALVSLDLVLPWPSASDSGIGLLPVLVPSGWAPDAVMSRRLSSGSSQEDETGKQFAEQMNNTHLDRSLRYCSQRTVTVLQSCELAQCCPTYVHCEEWTGWSEDDPVAPTLWSMKCTPVGQLMSFMLVAFGLICVIQPVFVFQYKEKVTEKRPPLQDGSASCTPTNDFAISPFSCFEDTPTCMHAFFCPCCRAADTYQGAGIGQYWFVIGYFILASFVGGFVGRVVVFTANYYSTAHSPTAQSNPGMVAALALVGPTISLLVVGGFLQRYRRKLRTKLGGFEGSGPNIFMDVLLYGFCTCCVVAQEARELDSATGVKVECCCQLTSATGQHLDAQPLVGQPQPLVGQPVYEGRYGHVA